jgi:hypothetical protein
LNPLIPVFLLQHVHLFAAGEAVADLGLTTFFGVEGALAEEISAEMSLFASSIFGVEEEEEEEISLVSFSLVAIFSFTLSPSLSLMLELGGRLTISLSFWLLLIFVCLFVCSFFFV